MNMSTVQNTTKATPQPLRALLRLSRGDERATDQFAHWLPYSACLLYTSDAADE